MNISIILVLTVLFFNLNLNGQTRYAKVSLSDTCYVNFTRSSEFPVVLELSITDKLIIK